MSAASYPVNNPYNPPSHNGKDRPTPTGTQVFPGDNRILTGNTGLSTGPHLHTQAGTDQWCQNVVDPTPYEFKPGEVLHVGTASQWGKYVIVDVGPRFICYAHLSKNSVAKGDKIGSMTKFTKAQIIVFHQAAADGKSPGSGFWGFGLVGQEVTQARLDALARKLLEVNKQYGRPAAVQLKSKTLYRTP